MTSLQFDYCERLNCVCGTEISQVHNAIKKNYSWGSIQFVKCSKCQSWCQSPRISPESLRRWISSEDYYASNKNNGGPYLAYLYDEPSRLDEAITRVKKDFAPYLNPGARIFEIGCATGSLLKVARDFGYEVGGIDLSHEFINYAKERHSLPVQEGNFMSVDISMDKKDQWDCVVLVGTVPTLQDLDKQLQKIYTILKPGGLLFLNFPKADSLALKIYGKNLWMFSPSVCTFLSSEGCIQTLSNSGFEIIRRRTDRQKPSLTKVLGHTKINRFFPQLRNLKSSSLVLPMRLPIPGIGAVWARRIN